MEPVRSEMAAKAELAEGKVEDKAEDRAKAVGWAWVATASAPRVERPRRIKTECHVQRSNVPNAGRR